MSQMDIEENTNSTNADVFSGHKLLLVVDVDLASSNVENIKFFCQGSIGMGILQKMERAIDIFDEMEKVTLIDPQNNNFDYLVEILCRIHRIYLVKKLVVDCKTAKRKYRDGDFTRTQLIPLRFGCFCNDRIHCIIYY